MKIAQDIKIDTRSSYLDHGRKVLEALPTGS